MVGVLLVLSEVLELREEELSALARGAVGRGLELVAKEGLNGRAYKTLGKQINDLKKRYNNSYLEDKSSEGHIKSITRQYT